MGFHGSMLNGWSYFKTAEYPVFDQILKLQLSVILKLKANFFD